MSFRGGGGGLRPRGPYQGFDLDPLETLSGPQTPRRLSSPLTQNPGSAPGNATVRPSFRNILVNSLESTSFDGF